MRVDRDRPPERVPEPVASPWDVEIRSIGTMCTRTPAASSSGRSGGSDGTTRWHSNSPVAGCAAFAATPDPNRRARRRVGSKAAGSCGSPSTSNSSCTVRRAASVGIRRSWRGYCPSTAPRSTSAIEILPFVGASRTGHGRGRAASRSGSSTSIPPASRCPGSCSTTCGTTSAPATSGGSSRRLPRLRHRARPVARGAAQERCRARRHRPRRGADPLPRHVHAAGSVVPRARLRRRREACRRRDRADQRGRPTRSPLARRSRGSGSGSCPTVSCNERSATAWSSRPGRCSTSVRRPTSSGSARWSPARTSACSSRGSGAWSSATTFRTGS